MNRSFWPVACIFTILFGGALELLGVMLIGPPPARPAMPVPGRQYVSATRDGQTDQSLFYFNMLGFGDRIRDADALVIGSSHAEFGIGAAQLAAGTHNKRPFNMAMGGGEGLSFAATLIGKYGPHPSIIALDTFLPDPDGPSTESGRVLASTAAAAYYKVFGIWSGFLRDWLLQGLLPRITISTRGTRLEYPIDGVIVRDWRTADIAAVYSNRGEIYSDPTKAQALQDGPKWPGSMPSPTSLSPLKAGTIVVTSIPYPGFDEAIARETAKQVAGTFVSTKADGLRWFDYHHVDAASREKITSALVSAVAPEKTSLPADRNH